MGRKQFHILLVEDESIIALDLEDLLERAGYRVTWCSRVGEALRSIREETFDTAVLDINVAGENIEGVADALQALKIPFVLCSGHSSEVVPERHRHAPFLTKPYGRSSVLDAVRGMCLAKAA